MQIGTPNAPRAAVEHPKEAFLGFSLRRFRSASLIAISELRTERLSSLSLIIQAFRSDLYFPIAEAIEHNVGGAKLIAMMSATTVAWRGAVDLGLCM